MKHFLADEDLLSKKMMAPDPAAWSTAIPRAFVASAVPENIAVQSITTESDSRLA